MDKEQKADEKIDETLNHFYKEKYSRHEKDLEELVNYISKDFFKKESTITRLLIEVEKEKNNFLRDLEKVEEDYDRLLEVNQRVFENINKSKVIVRNYKETEDSYFTYIKNLNALEEVIREIKEN